MTPEQIEAFAIRAALGNNGGTWSEHYTDSQKEHWRRFVRDLAADIEDAAYQRGCEAGREAGWNERADLS
jgi:hypothetical protein